VPDAVKRVTIFQDFRDNGTAGIGVGSFRFQIRRSQMITQSGTLWVAIMIDFRAPRVLLDAQRTL